MNCLPDSRSVAAREVVPSSARPGHAHPTVPPFRLQVPCSRSRATAARQGRRRRRAYHGHVPTLLLIRHGLTASTGRTLSGWTPGLHLDAQGERQAEALRDRLGPVPLAAFVTSPLERCVETATIVRAHRDVELSVDDRLGEVRYGDWTGRDLRALSKEPLWRVVQAHPSAAGFPGGEALREMQARAVGAVREWNERLGADATWAVCSHGDVIKALLADALGMHLDMFQRIHVDPCSLSVIHYTTLRPFVARVNDLGGSVADLVAPKKRRRRSADAVVGGGAG